MPAPVLAAPLVIPFAEAIGVSIAALGMAKATDKVNEFIQENPEQSIKIFQMIMPSQGIANALKNKSSEGDEEVSEDIDVEVEEKPKKLTGREKGMRIKEAIRRARAGKGNYSSPDAEGSAVDIRGSVIREAEDMGLADKDLKDKPYKEKGYDFRDYIPRGAYKKKYADGGSIGIEVLFEEKKPRKNFNTGGRATTQDFANALQRVSAGTTYQQQAQAKDYARQEASNLLSEAMRSGNQGNIQSILQGIGGSTTIPGMQFNRSGNRITSIPATGPGRDKILNAMANQMLSTTTYAPPPPPPPTDSLTGMLESQMLPNMADGSMRSLAEQNAIRDKVLAAQKAQEQSYFMIDPVTGKKYSTEAEAIDDLGLVTYNQRFADGGRVGLFMGGDPLTGQALSIYNSMNAYGFDDQAIADALQEQGYYDPNASTPDPTPDPGQSGGRGSDQNAGYVDRQDYSFNKKNYRPGNQLEINPAAFGVSFPDQPSSPKREGIINQAIDSFTSLPTRSLSSFASPTTGGNIVGPAEQGFMGQTLDIDPAARTREEIRSLYDNYNRFKGRTSNFADARQKGKVGEVLGNILGFASGIPFLGPLAMLSNAFGPQGDKSLQSKYTVDGAGFGNTGARDEFGLATFDKKDGFLGLTGNTTRDYTNRMNERLGELDDFFGERIDNFDINNIDAATFNKMSKINGTYAKQVQAYKNRLEVEKINKEQKEKERMEASAANRAEANAITNRLANEYKAQQQRDGRDFSVSGPDTSANPTGKSNQASSERGYALHGAKGGSVPTGLATMFKEKR
jgi:hypothetical protein